MLQLKIPRTAWKFCEILPTSRKFAENLKAIVMLENQIGIIFFSDQIYNTASDIRNIQFDGTFQLSLTSKKEELYHAVLNKISNMIPQLHPTTADWETGARNALKEEYPTTKLSGCWLHYTQAIWRRIQMAGLIQVFRENKEFTALIRNLMAIPFLPPYLILSTYSQLQVPSLHNNDVSKLKRIIGYFER